MANETTKANETDITGGWLDVSAPLHNGMAHWPDNQAFERTHTLAIDRGDAANVSAITTSVHNGTHMDAPAHFIPGGNGIETLPLTATMGPARVLEIHDPESVKPDELKPYNIQRGERILLKTRNSPRCWETDEFVKDFVYISHEAAHYLAEVGIQTVGIDYLSVGGYFKDGAETHHALLGAGIWIIEGLNLTQVQAGTYELLCLPLKIIGSDGAPARALLRKIE
jgi:arylformamidase